MQHVEWQQKELERQQTHMDLLDDLLKTQTKHISDLEHKLHTLQNDQNMEHGTYNKSSTSSPYDHVVRSVHKRQGHEGPVAFTAIKVGNQNNIGVNQNILFERVELNEGNGFHVNQGVFIAPRAGIYMFSFTIMSNPMNQYMHADLMLNGRIVAKVHGSTGTSWDQGSQTVFLNVSAGEDVYVQNADYDHEYVHGDMFTSFSGYLLYPL